MHGSRLSAQSCPRTGKGAPLSCCQLGLPFALGGCPRALATWPPTIPLILLNSDLRKKPIWLVPPEHAPFELTQSQPISKPIAGVKPPTQVQPTVVGGDCMSVQARDTNPGVILAFCPPKPFTRIHLDSGFLCQNIRFRTDNSSKLTVSENNLKESSPIHFMMQV